jgi:cold-inducible RNA-binding protein
MAPHASASAASEIDRRQHAGPPAQKGSNMKIYIGNLSPDSTEQNLRDLVTPFGKTDSVALVMDKATGKAKGFGFAEFANDEEAKAAIAGLNGKDHGGKPLTVNEARSKAAPALAAN